MILRVGEFEGWETTKVIDSITKEEVNGVVEVDTETGIAKKYKMREGPPSMDYLIVVDVDGYGKPIIIEHENPVVVILKVEGK